ncbi:MAG: hypothetical protein V3S07_10535 [Micropepsaceae bacterium]
MSARFMIVFAAAAALGAVAIAGSVSIAAESALDYEIFKSEVEPVFLKKREGIARCYQCHVEANNGFSLASLPAGQAAWNEEQSRLNFEMASRLVIPGDSANSRMLIHPLAPEAGGDLFHSGGRQFKSQDDPDWRAWADWVDGQ